MVESIHNMPQATKTAWWSWKIEGEDLRNQVEKYHELKLTESYRGISVLFIGALLLLSIILAYFGVTANLGDVLYGLIIYIPVMFFMYKGHRWAIIAMMILWTYEKAYQLYQGSIDGTSAGIGPIIWWFIVMPYFVKALAVENARKKGEPSPSVSGKKFCHHCGKPIDTDSKFCVHCGQQI